MKKEGKYWILDEGDEIKIGDEYSYPRTKKWCVGYKPFKDEVNHSHSKWRRRIKNLNRKESEPGTEKWA